MYKICNKCGVSKLLSEFRKFKSQFKSRIYYRGECRVCEKVLADQNKEKYRLIREQNKEEIKRKRDEFHEKYPWRRNLASAKQRCTNPKKRGWNRYGGKGIKFQLSDEDGKYLYYRDKAYLMDIPTLDRKDSNDNYTLENCQFLEKTTHDLKTQRENSFQCIKITQLDESNKVMKRWSSKSQITRLQGYSWNGLEKALNENTLYKRFYWKYT